MDSFSPQQQAAHQAIAEMTADLGPAFVLEAIADALEQAAQSHTSYRSDALLQAAGFVRRLVYVVSE